MASAEKYAQWIVANADKKGTKEFEIVSQAYQEAKGTGSDVQDSGINRDVMLNSRNQPTPTRSNVPSGSGSNLLDMVGGAGATALSMGSSAALEPVAGWAGLGAGAIGKDPSQAIDSVRGAAYQPRSQQGKDTMQNLGEMVEPIATPIIEGVQSAGDWVYDKTGSPAAAAATIAAPAAILELLGLKGLQSLRAGTRLLDAAGNSTPELDALLSDRGLTFETLDPRVIEAIPETVDPKLLGGSRTGDVGEQAAVGQISAQGRESGLAPYMVRGYDELVKDPLAAGAIKQGFPEGTVQMVKSASPETRAKMLRMTQNMKLIKGNDSVINEYRPLNVAGDSVVQRLEFINQKANDARVELNDIAQNRLAGKPIDTAPIENSLIKALSEADINLSRSDTGKPKAQYTGSMISKDRTSQRIINDLIDLMSEGDAPDALRFHKMKRQIDAMIDYRKKSSGGLTATGQKVLKNVRASLNDSLRQLDPDYARVNDVMSTALTAFDDLQGAAKVDLFGAMADRQIGNELRKVLSNYKSGVALDEALVNLDKVANDLGGNFGESLSDMVAFDAALQRQFGAAAPNSFKGGIESAIDRSARVAGGTSSATAEAIDAIVGGVSGKIKDMRGINDQAAFRSLEDLLKRGSD